MSSSVFATKTSYTESLPHVAEGLYDLLTQEIGAMCAKVYYTQFRRLQEVHEDIVGLRNDLEDNISDIGNWSALKIESIMDSFENRHDTVMDLMSRIASIELAMFEEAGVSIDETTGDITFADLLHRCLVSSGRFLDIPVCTDRFDAPYNRFLKSTVKGMRENRVVRCVVLDLIKSSVKWKKTPVVKSLSLANIAAERRAKKSRDFDEEDKRLSSHTPSPPPSIDESKFSPGTHVADVTEKDIGHHLGRGRKSGEGLLGRYDGEEVPGDTKEGKQEVQKEESDNEDSASEENGVNGSGESDDGGDISVPSDTERSERNISIELDHEKDALFSTQISPVSPVTPVTNAAYPPENPFGDAFVTAEFEEDPFYVKRTPRVVSRTEGVETPPDSPVTTEVEETNYSEPLSNRERELFELSGLIDVNENGVKRIAIGSL